MKKEQWQRKKEIRNKESMKGNVRVQIKEEKGLPRPKEVLKTLIKRNFSAVTVINLVILQVNVGLLMVK